MTADADGKRSIVIAGGSGFIGTSLAAHLTAAGVPVVVLARGSPRSDWKAELGGAAGLLNLVGRTGMVRLGATLVFNTDPELALYGRYVVSRRLREAGFEFRLPDLGPAIADLL